MFRGFNYINEIQPGLTLSRHERLIQLLSDENLKILTSKTSEIVATWKEIFESEKGTLNIIDDIRDSHDKILGFYNSIFSNDSKNEKSESKVDEIDRIHKDFQAKYMQAISGSTYQNEKGEKVTRISYFQEFENKHKLLIPKFKELESFHESIFGSDNKKGLKHELDERLQELGNIEAEAKKIINLSSDAGLAGGFFQRGEKAKFNKFISLGVFFTTLLVLGICNFVTIDFNNIKNISLEGLAIRLMVNFPLVWLAIVANINLNKYSRLEEEYAYKESLAKSFEKYKTEIEKLNSDSTKNSEELLVQLMKTNLDAFGVNPAKTMDSAKSDTPSLFNRQRSDKNTDGNVT